MTHIIICDDDKEIVDKVQNLIMEYHKEKRCYEKYFLNRYSDPEQLINEYVNNDSTLIFLDIGMKPIPAIQLAKRIRKIDRKASIQEVYQ